jgi:hypothetical protein
VQSIYSNSLVHAIKIHNKIVWAFPPLSPAAPASRNSKRRSGCFGLRPPAAAFGAAEEHCGTGA